MVSPWTGYAIGAVISIGLVGLFLWRRRLEPIYSRGYWLAVVSATTAIAYASIIVDRIASTHSTEDLHEPCPMFLWGWALFLPLCAGPYYLRSFILVYKYYWHHAKQGTVGMRFSLNWYNLHQKCLLPWVQFVTLAVVSLIHIVTTTIFEYAISDPIHHDPNLSSCVYKQIIPIAVLGIGYILVMMGLCPLLWKVHDTFYFKYELMEMVAIVAPIFTTIGISYLTPDSFTLQAPLYMVLGCIMAVIIFSILIPLILSYVEEARLRKHHMLTATERDDSYLDKRSGSDLLLLRVMDGGLDGFLALLKNGILAQSLQQFMVESWCVEHLLFFRDVQEYKFSFGLSVRPHGRRRDSSNPILSRLPTKNDDPWTTKAMRKVRIPKRADRHRNDSCSSISLTNDVSDSGSNSDDSDTEAPVKPRQIGRHGFAQIDPAVGSTMSANASGGKRKKSHTSPAASEEQCTNPIVISDCPMEIDTIVEVASGSSSPRSIHSNKIHIESPSPSSKADSFTQGSHVDDTSSFHRASRPTSQISSMDDKLSPHSGSDRLTSKGSSKRKKSPKNRSSEQNTGVEDLIEGLLETIENSVVADSKQLAAANHIMDTYIVDGANLQIHLDSHIRQDLIDIFSAGIPIGPDVFDNSLDPITSLIICDTLPRYLQSWYFGTAFKNLRSSRRETMELNSLDV